MTYTTPLMVADWAKANGHSCYFLKQNTLVYRHVIDGPVTMLFFYTSAAPFQHMTPTLPRILDSVCLPYRGKPEQTRRFGRNGRNGVESRRLATFSAKI